MPVPAKFGLGGVPDIGTPLLEAIVDEGAECAEADEGQRTDLAAECVTDIGTPVLEATEGEYVEFSETTTDSNPSFIAL